MEYPDIFTNLQKIAIIQSVKCNNAIEGIITKDKRAEEIVLTLFIPISKKEILNLFPDISITTIEKV